MTYAKRNVIKKSWKFKRKILSFFLDNLDSHFSILVEKNEYAITSKTYSA